MFDTANPEFLNHLFDGVIIVQNGRVAWANEAAKNQLGIDGEIEGTSLRLLSPEADAIISTNEQGRHHFWRQKVDPVTNIPRRDAFVADTRWFDESNGNLDGKLVFRDASEVVMLEKKLVNTAFKDEKSGLLTAVGFSELAGRRLSRQRKEDGMTILLQVAVPDLAKYENNAVVHDGVLRDVSIRIQQSLRGSDLAAHLGHDQFSVLVFNIFRLDLSLVVAKRFASLVSAPFECCGVTERLHARIGIAFFGVDGDSVQSLQKAASRACNSAFPAPGSFYSIAFANLEIQNKAEYEAARAERIVDEILGGAVYFEVCRFRNENERACLIRPALPDFGEEEIWNTYEQEGMAADLVRSVVDYAAKVEGDYFVLSFPARYRKIGNNCIALLAAERNLPISRYFSCHEALPETKAAGAVGLASVWDGMFSLCQLQAAGVTLLLAPEMADNPLINDEIQVAKRFFKVFCREPQ